MAKDANNSVEHEDTGVPSAEALLANLIKIAQETKHPEIIATLAALGDLSIEDVATSLKSENGIQTLASNQTALDRTETRRQLIGVPTTIIQQGLDAQALSQNANALQLAMFIFDKENGKDAWKTKVRAEIEDIHGGKIPEAQYQAMNKLFAVASQHGGESSEFQNAALAYYKDFPDTKGHKQISKYQERIAELKAEIQELAQNTDLSPEERDYKIAIKERALAGNQDRFADIIERRGAEIISPITEHGTNLKLAEFLYGKAAETSEFLVAAENEYNRLSALNDEPIWAKHIEKWQAIYDDPERSGPMDEVHSETWLKEWAEGNIDQKVELRPYNFEAMKKHAPSLDTNIFNELDQQRTRNDDEMHDPDSRIGKAWLSASEILYNARYGDNAWAEHVTQRRAELEAATKMIGPGANPNAQADLDNYDPDYELAQHAEWAVRYTDGNLISSLRASGRSEEYKAAIQYLIALDPFTEYTVGNFGQDLAVGITDAPTVISAGGALVVGAMTGGTGTAPTLALANTARTALMVMASGAAENAATESTLAHLSEIRLQDVGVIDEISDERIASRRNQGAAMGAALSLGFFGLGKLGKKIVGNLFGKTPSGPANAANAIPDDAIAIKADAPEAADTPAVATSAPDAPDATGSMMTDAAPDAAANSGTAPTAGAAPANSGAAPTAEAKPQAPTKLVRPPAQTGAIGSPGQRLMDMPGARAAAPQAHVMPDGRGSGAPTRTTETPSPQQQDRGPGSDDAARTLQDEQNDAAKELQGQQKSGGKQQQKQQQQQANSGLGTQNDVFNDLGQEHVDIATNALQELADLQKAGNAGFAKKAMSTLNRANADLDTLRTNITGHPNLKPEQRAMLVSDLEKTEALINETIAELNEFGDAWTPTAKEEKLAREAAEADAPEPDAATTKKPKKKKHRKKAADTTIDGIDAELSRVTKQQYETQLNLYGEPTSGGFKALETEVTDLAVLDDINADTIKTIESKIGAFERTLSALTDRSGRETGTKLTPKDAVEVGNIIAEARQELTNLKETALPQAKEKLSAKRAASHLAELDKHANTFGKKVNKAQKGEPNDAAKTIVTDAVTTHEKQLNSTETRITNDKNLSETDRDALLQDITARQERLEEIKDASLGNIDAARITKSLSVNALADLNTRISTAKTLMDAELARIESTGIPGAEAEAVRAVNDFYRTLITIKKNADANTTLVGIERNNFNADFNTRMGNRTNQQQTAKTKVETRRTDSVIELQKLGKHALDSRKASDTEITAIAKNSDLSQAEAIAKATTEIDNHIAELKALQADPAGPYSKMTDMDKAAFDNMVMNVEAERAHRITAATSRIHTAKVAASTGYFNALETELQHARDALDVELNRIINDRTIGPEDAMAEAREAIRHFKDEKLTEIRDDPANDFANMTLLDQDSLNKIIDDPATGGGHKNDPNLEEAIIQGRVDAVPNRGHTTDTGTPAARDNTRMGQIDEDSPFKRVRAEVPPAVRASVDARSPQDSLRTLLDHSDKMEVSTQKLVEALQAAGGNQNAIDAAVDAYIRAADELDASIDRFVPTGTLDGASPHPFAMANEGATNRFDTLDRRRGAKRYRPNITSIQRDGIQEAVIDMRLLAQKLKVEAENNNIDGYLSDVSQRVNHPDNPTQMQDSLIIASWDSQIKAFEPGPGGLYEIGRTTAQAGMRLERTLAEGSNAYTAGHSHPTGSTYGNRENYTTKALKSAQDIRPGSATYKDDMRDFLIDALRTDRMEIALADLQDSVSLLERTGSGGEQTKPFPSFDEIIRMVERELLEHDEFKNLRTTITNPDGTTSSIKSVDYARDNSGSIKRNADGVAEVVINDPYLKGQIQRLKTEKAKVWEKTPQGDIDDNLQFFVLGKFHGIEGEGHTGREIRARAALASRRHRRSRSGEHADSPQKGHSATSRTNMPKWKARQLTGLSNYWRLKEVDWEATYKDMEEKGPGWNYIYKDTSNRSWWSRDLWGTIILRYSFADLPAAIIRSLPDDYAFGRIQYLKGQHMLYGAQALGLMGSSAVAQTYEDEAPILSKVPIGPNLAGYAVAAPYQAAGTVVSVTGTGAYLAGYEGWDGWGALEGDLGGPWDAAYSQTFGGGSDTPPDPVSGGKTVAANEVQQARADSLIQSNEYVEKLLKAIYPTGNLKDLHEDEDIVAGIRTRAAKIIATNSALQSTQVLHLKHAVEQAFIEYRIADRLSHRYKTNSTPVDDKFKPDELPYFTQMVSLAREESQRVNDTVFMTGGNMLSLEEGWNIDNPKALELLELEAEEMERLGSNRSSSGRFKAAQAALIAMYPGPPIYISKGLEIGSRAALFAEAAEIAATKRVSLTKSAQDQAASAFFFQVFDNNFAKVELRKILEKVVDKKTKEAEAIRDAAVQNGEQDQTTAALEKQNALAVMTEENSVQAVINAFNADHSDSFSPSPEQKKEIANRAADHIVNEPTLTTIPEDAITAVEIGLYDFLTEEGAHLAGRDVDPETKTFKYISDIARDQKHNLRDKDVFIELYNQAQEVYPIGGEVGSRFKAAKLGVAKDLDGLSDEAKKSNVKKYGRDWKNRITQETARILAEDRNDETGANDAWRYDPNDQGDRTDALAKALTKINLEIKENEAGVNRQDQRRSDNSPGSTNTSGIGRDAVNKAFNFVTDWDGDGEGADVYSYLSYAGNGLSETWGGMSGQTKTIIGAGAGFFVIWPYLKQLLPFQSDPGIFKYVFILPAMLGLLGVLGKVSYAGIMRNGEKWFNDPITPEALNKRDDISNASLTGTQSGGFNQSAGRSHTISADANGDARVINASLSAEDTEEDETGEGTAQGSGGFVTAAQAAGGVRLQGHNGGLAIRFDVNMDDDPELEELMFFDHHGDGQFVAQVADTDGTNSFLFPGIIDGKSISENAKFTPGNKSFGIQDADTSKAFKVEIIDGQGDTKIARVTYDGVPNDVEFVPRADIDTTRDQYVPVSN